MSRTSDIMIFLLGVVAGSLVTWRITKTKYERLAADEIASVKEAFCGTEGDISEHSDIDTYTAQLQNNGYTNCSSAAETVERRSNVVDKPYVISPDQFGELDDYERISLTYYADHILADEDNNIVDDVEELVGTDSLSRFGEYEEDSVFVRNDGKCCDYEILLDQRTYSEIAGSIPPSI